jgi:hypothetical protein
MDKVAAYKLILSDHPLWVEKTASDPSGHHPAGYEEGVMRRYGTSLSVFRERWKAGKKVPIDVAEALDIETQTLPEKLAGMERLGIRELGQTAKPSSAIKRSARPIPDGERPDIKSVLSALGVDDDFFVQFKKSLPPSGKEG